MEVGSCLRRGYVRLFLARTSRKEVIAMRLTQGLRKEYLLSIHKALGPSQRSTSTKHGALMPVTLATGRWRREDQKLNFNHTPGV